MPANDPALRVAEKHMRALKEIFQSVGLCKITLVVSYPLMPQEDVVWSEDTIEGVERAVRSAKLRSAKPANLIKV